MKSSLFLFVGVLSLLHDGCTAKNGRDKLKTDISLWIDQKWIKEFTSFPMDIFAIVDGLVLPYILDPNFEQYLPIIPSAINAVNFTWRSGERKYFYEFDHLKSFNATLLNDPVVSIPKSGKVPRKAKVFQVLMACVGNQSGIATFGVGLRILEDTGGYLPGTPLRVKLQKHCSDRGPDPECSKKCVNGRCNEDKICECPKGYVGKYCHSALCYPKCMNGGTCKAPGSCECTDGYIGPHCEGGMCREKCLNGGKCINKDTCQCKKGYYGARCEYSKCKNVPCLNNGICIGINKCRCRKGFAGSQCEHLVESSSLAKTVPEGCKRKCAHGICQNQQCICDKGWVGHKCSRRRIKRKRQRRVHRKSQKKSA